MWSASWPQTLCRSTRCAIVCGRAGQCAQQNVHLSGRSVHDDQPGRAAWRSITWTADSSCCWPRSRASACWRSRRLGVARGTVQARLDRLQSDGVIRGFGPQVDPAALGYPVTAFATLQIRQGQGTDVRAHLQFVPRGAGAAHDHRQRRHAVPPGGPLNADLQRVIDRVVGFDGIVRASTAIVMENPVPLRIIPLVEQAATER